jgi:hypothetical protein
LDLPIGLVSDQGLVAIATAAVAAATAAATAAITTPATATTAATESTAATTTAATTEPTAATTASTTAVFARAGFVDGEGTSAVLLTIEGRNRRLGFVIRAHLDEAEALAAAGVTVVDDLRGDHSPVLTKQLLQFRAIHLVAQISNIQLLTHFDLHVWVDCGPNALDGSFWAGAKEVDTPTDAGGLRTKEGHRHELLSKADRRTRHLTPL